MTSIEAARTEAQVLLGRFGIRQPPVPVEDIVSMLNISLRRELLDDDLSGMAFVKDGAKVIVVNKAHHPNRQRFTIAHEIGHHVLDAEHIASNIHVDKAIFRRDRVSQEGSDQREIRANNFAAELLMPEQFVVRFGDVDINDEIEIAKIARLFQVSTAALSYRLTRLAS